MLTFCHYVDIVKYLGFVFTLDSKNDVDMQRQLRTCYARGNTILRQFAIYVMSLLS